MDEDRADRERLGADHHREHGDGFENAHGSFLVEPLSRVESGLFPCGETTDKQDETLFQVTDMNMRLCETHAVAAAGA